MSLSFTPTGLIIFSDAHLGMNDLRRKKQDIAERVREMAKLARHFGFHILGNGDITEHVSPSVNHWQMTEEAGRFDETLTSAYQKPYFAVHGNHDTEAAFNLTTLPEIFPKLSKAERCHFMPRLFFLNDILITHGDIAGTGTPVFRKMEVHLKAVRSMILTRKEKFDLLLEKIGIDQDIRAVIARQDVRFDTFIKANRRLPEVISEFFSHSADYLFQHEWGIHDLMQGMADFCSKPALKKTVPAWLLKGLTRSLSPIIHFSDRLAAVNGNLRLIVNGHSHVPRLQRRKRAWITKNRHYVYMNLGSFIGSWAHPPMIGTVDFLNHKAALWGWKGSSWKKAQELPY